MITGLTRGDLDVIMEVWRDNIPEAWSKALAQDAVVELGVNFPDANQGWFVPRYLVEGDSERGIDPTAPELKSVSDLPRYKTLFRDPEEPDKGRFYNCIAGWQCEVINTKKLEIYGLVDHYTNFRPGTGDALAAAIASAYKRGKPILAYYWGPTWVLGVYDMVMLEETPYNEKDWLELKEQSNPQVATAYPTVEVFVGVNKAFHDQAPGLIAFLDSYETTNALISELLAYMEQNKVDEQEAAIHFLRTRPETWTQWVPRGVAQKIEASLK
jgi:glycine betaine/proline transport system substrate-binding protein